jgi:solute carrier family 12 (sodium/potassium/chloride transporter), member 2
MIRVLKQLFGTDENGKFGAFGGVFTPSVLTILGVIMYLRFPWVVGHAGLMGALLIVIIAHALTIPTALSVASIATNRTVRAGGDYYMLSRSLGLEIGGAIGVALFFAQALSVSLYVLGFTEALLSVFPGLHAPTVAVVTAIAVAGLAFWNTSLAIKSQFVIMLLILLSLGAIFTGSGSAPPGDVSLWSKTVDGVAAEPFIAVFAVFFPAVTGFTQGVSMSGDLAEPRRSIPVGTFAAMGTGFVVYVGVIVFVAFEVDTANLRRLDPMVFKQVASVGILVVLGVLGATLSSAMGSVLGAPRILQALASDGVVPRFLGKGHGPTNMPRLATLVSLGIALVGIGLAYLSPSGLNAIAQVITMFFLASYGFISMACGLATWAKLPSFRPSLKVPAPISLVGAAGCFYMMSLINLPAMVASVIIVGLIYLSIHRRHLTKTWGDLRFGMWAALIRRGLVALRSADYHPINWQPHMVVLGGSPLARPHLLDLGQWVGGQRGLVTYFFLLRGELSGSAGRVRRQQYALQQRLERDYPSVFAKLQVCDDVLPEALSVVQAHGTPGFEPNTVLMGWSRDVDHAEDYVHVIRGLAKLDKCMILLSHHSLHKFGKHASIDLWWGGLENNGALMLLLSALITESPDWEEAQITVKMIVPPGTKADFVQANLERIIVEGKVDAKAELIVRQSTDQPIPEIIAQNSRADLVMLGLRLPADDEDEDPEAFVERVNTLIDPLGTCMLVWSSSEFEGAEMLFEKEYNPRKRKKKVLPKVPNAGEVNGDDVDGEPDESADVPHALEGLGKASAAQKALAARIASEVVTAKPRDDDTAE